MGLQEIKACALELKDLRSQKEALTSELKQVDDSIRNLEERRLDAMMSDEGLSDVTIDGVRINRGVVFRGGVTSHTDKDAFKYLFDTNNEGALTQMAMVDLASQPDALARLDAAGIAYEIKYTIHHMTLSAILKQLVADGKLSTEDFDKYSIYAQPRIKVELK